MKERDWEKDMLSLADAFFTEVKYDNESEFGSIGLDSKRPFGNSYVEGDIAKIIGFEIPAYEDDKTSHEEAEYYCRELYYDLPNYLQRQWNKFRAPMKLANIKITDNLISWLDYFLDYDETMEELFEQLKCRDIDGRYLIIFAEGPIVEYFIRADDVDYDEFSNIMGGDNHIAVFDLEEDRARKFKIKAELI